MKFEILGSGGAVVTPKPFCECTMCDEAREMGPPFARSGPSVFLHGPDVLFDTPEESAQQLTRSDITSVNACFYSHWHPDHTMGRRVWEHKRDCLSFTVEKPTDIYVPENAIKTFKERLGIWDHLQYMQEMGYLRLKVAKNREAIHFGEVEITPVALAESYVSAFVMKEGEKTTLLVIDEHIGWVPGNEHRNADLAILPMGILATCPWTGSPRLPKDHPIHGIEATFEDTLRLIANLQAKRVVLLHIEEPAQLSHAKAIKLSEKVRHELKVDVEFAYDQMIIDV